MSVITLGSLRGGAGVTSVVAMLGEALHRLGARVLLVDLSPADLLRLYFGVPHADPHGWAAAAAAGADWSRQVYEVDEGLFLAPFGRLGAKAAAQAFPETQAYWLDRMQGLESRFDWVLMDLGQYAMQPMQDLRRRARHDFAVVNPDASTHVLLEQGSGLLPGTCLLLNAFDPARRLGADIVLDWRYRHAARLLPVAIHRDESIHEALACKTTVSRYMPHSAASLDFSSLATWCLAQEGGA